MPGNPDRIQGACDSAWLDRVRGFGDRISVAFCIGLLLFLLLTQVAYVLFLGNGLSHIADAASEANALRAGQGYSEQGSWAHYGLPDVCYGNQFIGRGLKQDATCTELVYRRYPPGPDQMAGVLTRIFGVGRVALFRVWPLTVGICCIAFFVWRLALTFGTNRAALILLVCVMTPMFGNMMHGLHYQGYAFSLILVQWGVLLDLTRVPRIPLGRPVIAILFALGFAQGWLSFDYCFLVPLSAVPFWLWRWADGNGREWRDLLVCAATPLAGFLLAHGLHFLQVALYHGSLVEAIADYRGAAASYQREGGAVGHSSGLLLVFLEYSYILLWVQKYFSTLLPAVCAITVFLSVFRTGWLEGRAGTVPCRIEWRTNPRRLWAVAAALVVSSAWIVAMPTHAAYHLHFIPRHFFLFYLFGILFILQSMRGEFGSEALRKTVE